jgi:two-component system OmpR family response regulator
MGVRDHGHSVFAKDYKNVMDGATRNRARWQTRPRMKTLLIEDDKKIAEYVCKGLEAAGFRVERAEDGETGLSRALREDYDLLIVDVMLPKLDGLEVVSSLRSKGKATPVLFLSARRSVDERVQGFQSGGDDYLTKPFAFSELLVRCQALVRRASRVVEPNRLQYGPIVMDLLAREVRRDGKLIELQNKEYSLLEYFLRNPEHVLSKTQILEKIWHYDFDPQTNVVDVLVCRLRNKLERDYPGKLVKTIRGVGYVLRAS